MEVNGYKVQLSHLSGPGYPFALAPLHALCLAPKKPRHFIRWTDSTPKFMVVVPGRHSNCAGTGAVLANTVGQVQVYSKLFPSVEEYIIYDSIFLSVWRAFIKSIREFIR